MKKINVNIYNITLTLLLIISSPYYSSAQSCTLVTPVILQEQINALSDSCSIINGDLIIEGDSITDLNPLNSISEITGDLIIRNCQNLTNLEGIDLISKIGGDFIVRNNAILGFGGFPYELQSIGGDLIVENNDSLSSISILFSLQTIGENFIVVNNPSLSSAKDFLSLSTINGNFEMLSNGNLQSIGFPALKDVLGNMIFVDNSGDFNLNGFLNLQTISNDVLINQNSGLKQVNGFKTLIETGDIFITENQNLTRINGFTKLEKGSVVEISDNNELRNVSGFVDLASLSLLKINANANIQSINGFDSLNTVTYFEFRDNIATSESFSLKGFDNLANVLDFNISGNTIISNITGFTKLKNVQGLSITNNIGLIDITGFDELKNIGKVLEIADNQNLTTISNFELLESGNILISNNNSLSEIKGFDKHLQGSVSVNNNSALTSINAWENLLSGRSLDISDNPNLSLVNGFENFSNNVLSVQIKNNPLLSVCCWALPAISESNSNDGVVIISGNAIGCENLEQFNFAPILSNCPPDLTINTEMDKCIGIATLITPSISDNCAYSTFTLDLIYSTGDKVSEKLEEEQTLELTLNLGNNYLSWSVSDESGNKDRCETTINVIDQNMPEFTTSIPDDITISSNISCFGEVSITFPDFQDNCSSVISKLSIFEVNSNDPLFIQNEPIPGSKYNFDLEAGNYSINYNLKDAHGNESNMNSFVLVEDTLGPVIILNQDDLTINCMQPLPIVPEIGSSVFAIDACNGDVSANMAVTSSNISGDCTAGQEQEIISYTFTASDNSGNTTEKSFTITILNSEAVDLGEDKIGCNGEDIILSASGLTGTYLWSTGETSSSIVVNTAGSYSVTVTGISGCCSMDEVNVLFNTIPDVSATGGTITCNATSVQLLAESTSPSATYEWSGPGGFTSNDQNPNVSNLGEYLVTVRSSEGCSNTAVAIVNAGDDLPDATAQGGTINCSNSSVQLLANSTTAGVIYSWTGPGNYTSSEQNPSVSIAGIYTLEVKKDACMVTVDAEVVNDTLIPAVSLNKGILDCISPDFILTPEITTEIETYSWIGPNGIISNSDSLIVTSAGIYDLTVTALNGCKGQASVEISENKEIPSLIAEGGMINCIDLVDTLMGLSTTNDINYSWSGPNDFTASISNPIVVTPGIYTVNITGKNGCVASESVELKSDTDMPMLHVNGGFIDCNNSSVILEASSETDGITYSWSGPNNFTGNMASVTTALPGFYTVIATSDNGCTNQVNVEVIDSTKAPTVTISAEDLNCNNPETLAFAIGSEDVTSFSWSGPNEFTSLLDQPLLIDTGTYNLIVTNNNGCSAEATLVLKGDFTEPTSIAESDTLSCTKQIATLKGSSSSENVLFSWIGPNNYNSILQNPVVAQAGIYTLIVTGENGCISEANTEVIADSDLPNISAIGGSLDCINNEVMLIGTTLTEDATFIWTGPNGYTSDENNPTISNVGEYTFTVTSASGCIAFRTVPVTIDTIKPEVQLSFGEVHCEEASISINPSLIEGFEFQWAGPNEFTSIEDSPLVSLAGVYIASITGSNGCESTSSIELGDDIDFQATVLVDGSSASLEISGGNGPFSFLWDEGNSPDPSNLSAGEHTVRITDNLGCTKVITFTILPSSVEDLVSALNFEINPNPVQELVNLNWRETNIKIQRLNILDQSGKIVFELDNNILNDSSYSINVSDWTPGIYYISIISSENADVVKFVKF